MRGWLPFFLLLTSTLSALDFAGLQAKVSSARPGETVLVPAGDYIGQLVVDRAIVLKGTPGSRLIHEPTGPRPTLTITAPGAVVEGLVVVGSGQGKRQDLNAVLVAAPRVRLVDLVILEAHSGVAIEADGVEVDGLVFRGLADYPFWERGQAVQATKSRGTKLARLDLAYTEDAVLLTEATDTALEDVRVADGRYGVHIMFGASGTIAGLQTRRTVVGLMAMETSGWTITGSTLTEGYRTGSAGIRVVRGRDLVFSQNVVSRQAAGFELLDLRGSRITGNRIEENATAWTWGGDNSGTLVTANGHRGNLLDAAGAEASGEDWDDAAAHDHGPRASSPPVTPGTPTKPQFDRNFWDAWKGLDLDADGVGDTPYRFDRAAAVRVATRPWFGVFLGSPWSLLSQGLPGGEVLDPRPLSRWAELPPGPL